MILETLREATRPAHEQLEAHIDLLGRDWSIGFYRRLLEKFYGFYAAIEPQIFARAQWSKLGIDIEKRRKLPKLQRDLLALGLRDDEIVALPTPTEELYIESFAQALGAAYVLEGSTLGGQVITRHLKQTLELSPETGGAFFASYGAEVGPMWRQFVEVLNTYPVPQDERQTLVESACATFTRFDEWLADIL